MPGGLLLLAHLHRTLTGPTFPLDLTPALAELIEGAQASGVAGTGGLHVGLGGLWTLARRLRALGCSEEWESLAAQSLSALLESATRLCDGDLPEDEQITDVMSGASGMGLVLLEAARAPSAAGREVELAKRLGDWLIAEARPVGDGPCEWLSKRDLPRTFLNFSHGTAGIACYLAELSRATADPGYLEAALRGAASLERARTANGTTAAWHHNNAEPNLYYAGWCHGPAGTARMYHSLHRASGEAIWLRRVRECANWVLEHARPDQLLDGSGYWNLGLCCGTAGVGDFLLDAHEITSDAQYLVGAKRLAEHLVRIAEPDRGGLRWSHAENRSNPEARAAQTGLMQGAAGIGLFLLKVHLVEAGATSLSWSLPDNTLCLPM